VSSDHTIRPSAILLATIDGVVDGALFMAAIAGGVCIARHFDSRRTPPS
jgi:hypothetical protein